MSLSVRDVARSRRVSQRLLGRERHEVVVNEGRIPPTSRARVSSRRPEGCSRQFPWGVSMAFAALFVLLSAGCVETAECNESVRCPDGEVCYRYVCRRRCDSDEDCPDGAACQPCEPASGESRCFGIEGRACVAVDVEGD